VRLQGGYGVGFGGNGVGGNREVSQGGMMTFSEYQIEASRTANTDLDPQTRLLIATIGLVGEAGELANVVKKHVGHGHSYEVTIDKIADELGDIFWYIFEFLNITGLDPDEVILRNI